MASIIITTTLQYNYTNTQYKKNTAIKKRQAIAVNQPKNEIEIDFSFNDQIVGKNFDTIHAFVFIRLWLIKLQV